MPLARIITESVDDSLELTMQLRARGFLVETVSPDQIPDAPADLEVRLEECSPEEVLSKAAQVTESEDLWVFVAPGALDERARPIRTIPLLPHAFDVPTPTVIPNSEREWFAEAGEEKNSAALAAPLIQATPAHGADAIPSGSGNGGGIPADLKREPALGPSVILPSGPAHATPDIQQTKVRVVVLPKLTDVPQIPGVPDQPAPINLEPVAKMPGARMRLRGPYKISFRTGARFWKVIAVSAPLAIVAALLVGVAALRPHLPPSAKPAVSAAPSLPNAGVKSGTAHPVVPANPSPASAAPAGAAVPQVTRRAAPQIPPPASPQVAAKPALKSPTAPNAKPSPETPHNVSDKPASPVANDPNKAASVIKTQPVRRHSASSESDVVAEDTVVFYDRKPGSSGKPAQNPSGKQ